CARALSAGPRARSPSAPVSMFFPALCRELSGWLGLPVDIVIKLFAVAADVGVAVALYALGARLLGERRARGAAALYAVNPGSILVASFHRNVMSFVVLLMLAAYLLFPAAPQRPPTPSALLLRLALRWPGVPA